MASANGLLSVGKQIGDPFQEALSKRTQQTAPSADSINTTVAEQQGKAASSPDLRERAELAKAKYMKENNVDENGNPLPKPSVSPDPSAHK